MNFRRRSALARNVLTGSSDGFKRRRYHHIINPATGTPTEGILSVTVIGPDATLTDGLSTTLFVLGADPGLELIETLPAYEAIIVEATGRLSFSSGLVPPEG